MNLNYKTTKINDVEYIYFCAVSDLPEGSNLYDIRMWMIEALLSGFTDAEVKMAQVILSTGCVGEHGVLVDGDIDGPVHMWRRLIPVAELKRLHS